MNILGVAIFLVVLMLVIVASIILALIAGLLLHTCFFFMRVYLVSIKRRLFRGVTSPNKNSPCNATGKAYTKRNNINYRKKLIDAYFNPILKFKRVRNQSTVIHKTNAH